MSATAADFYRELVAWGYSVTADGEQLLVAPRDRITDQLRQRIREAKPDLLQLLKPRPAVASPPSRAQQPRGKSPLSPLSPGPKPEIVALRVFRVLVAMDEGQAPRWVTMLGCTDDNDAKRSAAGTFGADRVIDIHEQK